MKLHIIKLFFITALLFLFHAGLAEAAEPDVVGHVITAGTNAPVVGVWVRWQDSAGDWRYAKTDNTGKFLFPDWSSLALNGPGSWTDLLNGTNIDTNLDGATDSKTAFLTQAMIDAHNGYWAGFDCARNAHTFTVTRPAGWIGTFSSLTQNINNGSGTLDIGTLIYTATAGPPAPTPTPVVPPVNAGNITGLNFGISNFNPWIQSTCGNIRLDGGVNNILPNTAAYMIRTDANCTTPGILHVGNGPAALGQGQPSSTGWESGGVVYPEKYKTGEPVSTSYANITAKVVRSGSVAAGFPCTANNCTLPNNLASGAYSTPGDLVLNAYTISPNRNYVFLVGGNLLIQGSIIIPQGTKSSAFFSVRGNITVSPTVGVVPTSMQTVLEGFYSTDQSFIVNSTGDCTELRLNIGGAVITNAARGGGSFQNKRDICGADADYPTVSIAQRLDLLLNAPAFLTTQHVTSQEVAP